MMSRAGRVIVTGGAMVWLLTSLAAGQTPEPGAAAGSSAAGASSADQPRPRPDSAAPPQPARHASGALPLGLPPVFSGVQLTAPMPERPDAWVLHVITRGGLGRSGFGGVTITSSRAVSCAQRVEPCAPQLTGNAYRSLTAAVERARTLPWTGALGHCMDCYATLMVLRRRQADGSETVSTAYWDVTTQHAVAEDLKQLYSMAMAGR